MVTCSRGLMMWRNRMTEQSAQRKGESKHKIEDNINYNDNTVLKDKDKSISNNSNNHNNNNRQGEEPHKVNLLTTPCSVLIPFKSGRNFAYCLIHVLFLLCFICLCIFYFTVSSSAVSIENGTFTWSSRNAPVLKEWVLKVNGEIEKSITCK